MNIPLTLLICVLGFTTSSWAQDRPFIDEYDNTLREDLVEPEWKEGDITLPDGYEEEDLQEFEVEDDSGRFRYFIDRDSLHTHADGVSRFMLVIRSEMGAENTTYEGFRCGKREYKVYAFGSQAGLQALKNPVWASISRSGSENYRNTLYNDLICNLSTGKANPPAKVFRAMQRNRQVKTFFFDQD